MTIRLLFFYIISSWLESQCFDKFDTSCCTKGVLTATKQNIALNDFDCSFSSNDTPGHCQVSESISYKK